MSCVILNHPLLFLSMSNKSAYIQDMNDTTINDVFFTKNNFIIYNIVCYIQYEYIINTVPNKKVCFKGMRSVCRNNEQSKR